MDTTTRIRTLEEVRDMIRYELNARGLDEITHELNGNLIRADDNPINRLYTKLEDQIVSLKIRERAK